MVSCNHYPIYLLHTVNDTFMNKLWKISLHDFTPFQKRKSRQGHVIEQLGTFDPLVNVHGEKLCSVNLDRTTYWIGTGAHISLPCSILFGKQRGIGSVLYWGFL